MVKKELYDKMINHAYRKFKAAQGEMIKQNNLMEYWFVKALKLEDDSHNKANEK